MPKTKVAPLPPDDVPIWDALVTELGDPRPYEPTVTEFTAVTQPDELLVDDAGFDTLSSDLDDVRDDALVTVVTHELQGVDAAHALVADFRARHGIVPLPDPILQDMRDQTVVLPVLRPGERTVRIEGGDVEWPS